jgi:peptidoglycan/xylan/chitin deacetylase (PgdA/CDA1 family)
MVRNNVPVTLITLTFDDALDVHLDHVIPTLNRHGLRATFYIPLAACSIGRRAAEWQRAAETGHELGNHSIFHPAEGSQPWVREANNLDLYTLDRMQMELEVANNILKALDGRDDRTFAYPCSNPVLGNVGWPKRFLRTIGRANTRISSWLDRLHLDLGASRHNYSSLLQDLFVAARGVGPAPGLPSLIDFTCRQSEGTA